MRRLARRLFTLCSAVSMLLLFLSLALWAAEGHLVVWRDGSMGWPHGARQEFLGFVVLEFHGYDGLGSSMVVRMVPCWFLAALTAILPSCWLIVRQRRLVRLRGGAAC